MSIFLTYPGSLITGQFRLKFFIYDVLEPAKFVKKKHVKKSQLDYNHTTLEHLDIKVQGQKMLAKYKNIIVLAGLGLLIASLVLQTQNNKKESLNISADEPKEVYKEGAPAGSGTSEHTLPLSQNNTILLIPSDKEIENESLVTEEYISSFGNDLSPYSEEEKLIIRRFFTYRTLDKSELPVFFKYYVDGMFKDGDEDSPNAFKKDVDDSWISSKLANHSMANWETASDEGDVLSTMILARFYKDTGYVDEAESYYLRAFVNINEGGVAIESLMTISKQKDEEKAAAYAWYAMNNNLHIYDIKTLNDLTKKYSLEEVSQQLLYITNEIESLQVNYANSEKIDIKKLIN